MNEDLLTIQDLRVEYEATPNPVRAVNRVSLVVKKEEIFGVCGESGCGKSTLMKAITGLIRPPGRIVEGKIIYRDTDLTALKENDLRKIRWKEISYIPQASMNSLNPVLKIIDQMAETVRAHGQPVRKNDMYKVMSESLNSVLLSTNVMRLYPHELSGGMKQRVLISMAVGSSLLQPKLIIADEPTSNLDVTTERYILKVLTELKEKLGVSIVFVTHNIAAQAQIADRIAIMYAGEVMEIGNVDDMFREPLHPYTQALMAATPMIGARKKLSALPGIPPDLRNLPQGCSFNPRCAQAMAGKCDVANPELIEVGPNRFVKCHLVGRN